MEVITWAAHSNRGGALLTGALLLGAALILAYRIYRLTKGGPIADVYGGAVLSALLIALALLVAADISWARWPAAAYALLFALVVMPVWTLGVLLPMRPGPVDVTFTIVYWATLVVTAVAALI